MKGGSCQERGGGVFEVGWYPNAHNEWLVDFNAGKTQLVLFDWSNNSGAIDVRMDEFVLEEK